MCVRVAMSRQLQDALSETETSTVPGHAVITCAGSPSYHYPSCQQDPRRTKYRDQLSLNRPHNAQLLVFARLGANVKILTHTPTTCCTLHTPHRNGCTTSCIQACRELSFVVDKASPLCLFALYQHTVRLRFAPPFLRGFSVPAGGLARRRVRFKQPVRVPRGGSVRKGAHTRARTRECPRSSRPHRDRPRIRPHKRAEPA